MNTKTQAEGLREVAERAIEALEYAALHLGGLLPSDLPPGITESTGAGKTALIAARDLRAALAAPAIAPAGVDDAMVELVACLRNCREYVDRKIFHMRNNGSVHTTSSILLERIDRALALAAPQDGEADQPVGDDLWRYEAEIVHDSMKPYIHFRHEADGGWVHFTDYDRLSQQLAATIAELRRMTEARDNWQALTNATINEKNEAIAERDRAVKDAKRYHFLRDVGPPDSAGYPTILQWKLVTQERGSGRLLFGDDLDHTIDRAIDAAIAAGGEGGRDE